MSSVQVSYWHPAVMRTVEYLQGGVLGDRERDGGGRAGGSVGAQRGGVGDGAACGGGQPARAAADGCGAADELSADLGRIGVSSTLEHRVEREGRTFGAAGVETEALLDCIRVTIEQMQQARRGAGGADDSEARMVRDEVVDLTVERGIGESAGRPYVVVGSGGELVCSCSKAQYELLMRVLTQNLAGRADTRQHAVLLAPASSELTGEPTAPHAEEDTAAADLPEGAGCQLRSAGRS